jgi:uncharacterized damage-inducible protein DinB
MKITDLQSNEYPAYAEIYVSQVDNTWTLVEELEVSVHNLIRFVQNIPLDKHDYRYAEGKWTIKDILQHLIDAERVFAYRALRFSRNDTTELPGYDQDLFVENAHANKRHMKDLLTELSTVRHSTMQLFSSFSEEQLLSRGIASGYNVSVRALGFMIIGHQIHHMKVFQERYLDN